MDFCFFSDTDQTTNTHSSGIVMINHISAAIFSTKSRAVKVSKNRTKDGMKKAISLRGENRSWSRNGA